MKITPQLVIGILGILSSFFYGIWAARIFSVDETGKKWYWRLHQFWLNFLGSASGWICLIIISPGIINSIQNNASLEISKGGIVLFLLAFTGVTGYLPTAVITVIQGLSIIISKVPGFLKLDK